MSNETVIVNASPLIGLFRAGLEHILGEMWGEVLVPDAVWREVTAAGKTDRAALGLPRAEWAKRVSSVELAPLVAAWDLGAGESGVLSLALTREPARVVVDDAQARKCAQALGLRLSGTGGVLVLAKRRGLIAKVSDALDNLTESGFRLSPVTASLLKAYAGE